MKNTCLLLLTATLFIGCTSPQVITYVGKDPRFENYYTYRIVHNELPPDNKEGRSDAELFMAKVENVIHAHMNSRGYSFSEISDITIEYKLVLENKVDYRRDDSYRHRYPNYNYNAYRYYPYAYYSKREYTEGTLIVDIRESYGKRLAWEASLDLKYNKNHKGKADDPVERAFNSILEQYPYRAGSSDKVVIDHN